MKFRISLLLIAVVALLAGLALPAAAQEGGAGNVNFAKKKNSGKKGSCKKGSAQKAGGKKRSKKKAGGKQSCKGSGKNKAPGAKAPGSKGPGKVGASAPDCTSAALRQCFVDVWVHQGSPLTGAVCGSFSSGEGSCMGSSSGTTGWHLAGFTPKYGIGTWFTWRGGTSRTVDYTVDATFTIVEAYIRGTVPSPGSSTFIVDDAWNRMTDTKWKTVSSGGYPGLPNGPLYIDYGYGVLDSYVHMYGYLVRQ